MARTGKRTAQTTQSPPPVGTAEVDVKNGDRSEVLRDDFAKEDGLQPRLNVELHARLLREGTARPSTLDSAMAALRGTRLTKVR